MHEVQSDSRTYVFRVDGLPAPQGSKRGFIRGGRVVLVEQSKGTLDPWRSAVALAAADALDSGLPISDAVTVDLVFRFVRPKSTKRLYPTVRPDLDKLVRGVLDGLTIQKNKPGGMLTDDSIVVELHTVKTYAVESGVDVIVRPFGVEHDVPAFDWVRSAIEEIADVRGGAE